MPTTTVRATSTPRTFVQRAKYAWGVIRDKSLPEATFQSGPGVDPDEDSWRRIGTSNALKGGRDLSSSQLKTILDLSHQAFKANPIAKRIIEITAEFVIGDGIQIVAENAKVQQLLDTHWMRPGNRWSTAQVDRVRDLGLTGELLMSAVVNQVSGMVDVGHIDTGLIGAIIEHPDVTGKQYAVTLNKKIGNENFIRAYKVVDYAEVPSNSKASGKLVGLPTTDQQMVSWGIPFKKGDSIDPKLIPNELGVGGAINSSDSMRWYGTCFFEKVNSPMSSQRGWSDLMQSLDWVEALDQAFFSETEKVIATAMLLLDVKLTGANADQQEKFLREMPPIKPMQSIVHNEAVEYNFLIPDLKLQDITSFLTALKNLVIGGTGHPPFWFGEATTARATAPEMTEPSYKHMRVRQRVYANLVRRVLRYQIDMATLIAGFSVDNRISPGTDTARASTAFYLKMVDLSAKDFRALSNAIRVLTEAIVNAKENELMSDDEGKRLVDRLFDLLGIDAWRDEPDIGIGTGMEINKDLHPLTIFKKAAVESSDVVSTQNFTCYLDKDPSIHTGTSIGAFIQEKAEALFWDSEKERLLETSPDMFVTAEEAQGLISHNGEDTARTVAERLLVGSNDSPNKSSGEGL